VALLLTLMIVTLLLVVVLDFDTHTRLQIRSAAHFREGLQAAYLAKAGVSAARAALKDDKMRHAQYDGPDELWATPLFGMPVGPGSVSGEIVDESGKLSINKLSDNQEYTKWKPVWERLLKLLEVEEPAALVGALKDWVDADSETTDPFYSGESDYYERLSPPYRCKNGPMDSVTELRLIRGMTPALYDKLAPLVTTAQTKTVNVNTMSRLVCQALDDRLDQEICRRVEEGRPYEKPDDVDKVTGISGAGNPLFDLRSKGLYDVKSDFFTATARGQVDTTIKAVTALLQRDGTKVKVLSWRVE
jgi:general secretion pathway protein K